MQDGTRPASVPPRGSGRTTDFYRRAAAAEAGFPPPDTWPQALHAMVGLMLDAACPVSIAIGPELHFMHNDACLALFGGQSPRAFGSAMRTVFGERWHQVGPYAERALAGHAGHQEQVALPCAYPDNATTGWFNLCHWPVRNADAVVIGLLTFYTDTTAQVLLAQRAAYLRALAAEIDAAPANSDIATRACQLLGRQLGARVRFSNQAEPPPLEDASGAAASPQEAGMTHLPGAGLGPGPCDGSTLPGVPVVLAGHRGALLHIDQLPPGAHAAHALTLAQDTAERLGPALQRVRAVARRIQEAERLQAQIRKFQIAADSAELGFFDHDLISGDLYWSDRLYFQLGVAPGTRVTRKIWLERLHVDDRERVSALVAALLAGAGDGKYHAEYRTVARDGSERWIAARGQVHYSDTGQALRLFGVTMDISERKLLDRKIQEAAQHDELTGLPTRALLVEHCRHILARSARSGEPGAVIFLDLDRFKPVNDLYGHEVGDAVLAAVTKRLLACTRSEDIVSRHGGDEFIVVLPKIDAPDDAMLVAQNILAAVRQPVVVGALTLNVSASIGISVFPDHAQNLDVLIRCADLAMYSAKKSGRNAVKFYSAGHNEQANNLLRLEIQVRNALHADTMVLFYQPIMDVLTRRLIGVEALIRMAGANGSLVHPLDFIPVAEAAGLINPIGNWVIREACRQHGQWRAAGLPPVAIAVNVSPSQFRQASFTPMLAQAIAEFDVAPAFLQIELTESAVMDNVDETVIKLAELQAMGIQISLDDFGTGYSSLSHLSRLPLDKLKIDQSFIRSLGSTKSSRSITEAIIGLGRTLNLTVVGEGIESEESMTYLQDYGCDQVQGFLFSEPLPPAHFASWYRASGL